MEIPESALSEMIVTQHWRQFYGYIVDQLSNGDPLVIKRADGTCLALSDQETALQVLREQYGMQDDAAA